MIRLRKGNSGGTGQDLQEDYGNGLAMKTRCDCLEGQLAILLRALCVLCGQIILPILRRRFAAESWDAKGLACPTLDSRSARRRFKDLLIRKIC